MHTQKEVKEKELSPAFPSLFSRGNLSPKVGALLPGLAGSGAPTAAGSSAPCWSRSRRRGRRRSPGLQSRCPGSHGRPNPPPAGNCCCLWISQGAYVYIHIHLIYAHMHTYMAEVVGIGRELL